jgi:hypothetical protein
MSSQPVPVVLTEYDVAWREAESKSKTVSILIVHITIRSAPVPPTPVDCQLRDARDPQAPMLPGTDVLWCSAGVYPAERLMSDMRAFSPRLFSKAFEEPGIEVISRWCIS